MPTRTRSTARPRRAARKPRTSPVSDTPARDPELSGYELLERRSRELEAEHARGGFGTAQSPYDAKPLLYSHPDEPHATGPKRRTSTKTPASATTGRRRRERSKG